MDIFIQHALNGGEKRLFLDGRRLKVDGFYEADGSATVLEFLGCLFHGCSRCFVGKERKSSKHPVTGQSMDELLALTMKRLDLIKKHGYTCTYVWEHEWDEMRRQSDYIKTYPSALDIQDPLDARDSFYGGRVNAFKMYEDVGDTDDKIYYYDFCSLYPYCLKTKTFPVGHPIRITSDFRPLSRYFGFAKVLILPPRKLYLPVLPKKVNGKLMFPLCSRCASLQNQDSPCRCSDEERSWVGSFCIPELIKALEKGYLILKTYKILHFEETTGYDPETRSGGLWAEYVDKFLKVKQEASGWFSDCDTSDKKEAYMREYFHKEGIRLDPSKIEKNSGLRSVAKLCLNSLWGKFAHKENMKQSKFIHDSRLDQFYDILTDPSKKVHDFHILTENFAQLSWKYDSKYVPVSEVCNVYLASFKTAYARLRLYQALESFKPSELLYCDTDSIVVKNDSYKALPRFVGSQFGFLTSELPENQWIECWVSGGCKNYALKTNTGSTVCKIRGFTLNYANSRALNFETMKDLVLTRLREIVKDGERKGRKRNREGIPVTNRDKICRDPKSFTLYNRPETKSYDISNDKRVLRPDFSSVTYGY